MFQISMLRTLFSLHFSAAWLGDRFPPRAVLTIILAIHASVLGCSDGSERSAPHII